MKQGQEGGDARTLVSVIVLNWNGRSLLSECLTSLSEQTYSPYEILVVDNGSIDGSVDYVRECFPHVRLIALPDNVGFCEGNLVGYRHARGNYIALLNNDTRVVTEWLAQLFDALQRHPSAGSAASKMLLYDQPTIIDTAGDLYFRCGIGRKRGHLFEDNQDLNREAFVFGACAGAAMYRRSMLEQIGFLDGSFFAYNEDIDLSFRAQLAGWKCIYVPGAQVLHRLSETASRMPEYSVYLSKRNSLWVVWKNMPMSLLLKFGLLVFAYHLASDVKGVIQGRARPIVRGRLDALRAWKAVCAKRKSVQAMRNVSTVELEQAMSTGLPSRAGG